MKAITRFFFSFFLFLNVSFLFAQHRSNLVVNVDIPNKILTVEQEITFTNTTNDTIREYVLNDWNNAYSDKNSPLGKKFSDEFIRSFHLAKDSERGRTIISSITDQNGNSVKYSRPEKQIDLLNIHLPSPIVPNQELKLKLRYAVHVPNQRFTRFGYDDKIGSMHLKYWFLSPARIDKGVFVKNSNENLDDIANALCDYEIKIVIPTGTFLFTDLNSSIVSEVNDTTTYQLTGRNITDFQLVIEAISSFSNYKNKDQEIVTNLRDKRLNDIQKAIVIDRVVRFVSDHMGKLPQEKVMVSQVDYDRNPFYGLNQLPAFLSPFSDEFLYELKFLKTYLHNYLKTSLHINPRKDTWIIDGIQTYMMMKYIGENYPDMKMVGRLSEFKLLKGHNLFTSGFNNQYSYLYLLMARKNLDQPIGDPKNTFIKFNEQISGRYKAGMSLNYLNDYLGDDIVSKTIMDFTKLNHTQQTDESHFKYVLNQKTNKNTDWFFNTMVHSRDLIDFKFGKLKTDKDSISVTIKNKTRTNVPVSVYGISKDTIVFKRWIDNIATDSILTFPRHDVKKLVLNYENTIPEYNARNNWKAIKSFFGNNRPFKFTFIKDLEDSSVNQIFYVPELSYNYYDGLSPGLSFHNKSLLDKPFIF